MAFCSCYQRVDPKSTSLLVGFNSCKPPFPVPSLDKGQIVSSLLPFFPSWYLKAQHVAPKNGRPYNQLALLAVYTVRYSQNRSCLRSIALRNVCRAAISETYCHVTTSNGTLPWVGLNKTFWACVGCLSKNLPDQRPIPLPAPLHSFLLH